MQANKQYAGHSFMALNEIAVSLHRQTYELRAGWIVVNVNETELMHAGKMR